MKIEVLPRDGKVKYLGRQITFENGTVVELSNRIKAAWAKFMQYKQELTTKQYSLFDRFLYGSETWTLTKEMSKLLRTTQRRMLRMILGQGRRRKERRDEPPEDESWEETHDDTPEEDSRDDLEPWLDWIKRVTHSVESSLQKLRIKTWVEQARKRKWKWAAEMYSGAGEKKMDSHSPRVAPADTFRFTATPSTSETSKTECKVD